MKICDATYIKLLFQGVLRETICDRWMKLTILIAWIKTPLREFLSFWYLFVGHLFRDNVFALAAFLLPLEAA